MDESKGPISSSYAVSRSRGKQAGGSVLSAELRERRKAKGQARSSDDSESEEENEPGQKASDI
jgi:hypothetical protein